MMIIKRLRYLLVFVVMSFALVSCFQDDTTLGTKTLSEILIDSTSISRVYNIAPGDTLTIAPRITQTHQDKEVTYAWEIELEAYSDSTIFEYVGKNPDSLHCRLIVQNEDGKSFFPFNVYVNADYEEGLTVISKDADGKAMLSFMLTPPDGSAPTGFMRGDQFSAINEEPFADNPIDMVQSSGSLFIACQGSDDGTSPATIYCLNEKTFVLENVVTDPEFTDFKPTILGIPSIDYAGRSYPVICEGGHTYEFSTTEGALTKAIKLPHSYAQTAITYTKNGGYYDFLCWDNELNALCLIYNGYAPAYYCGEEYHTERDSIILDNTRNIFNGQSICKMVFVEQKTRVTTPKALIITKNKRNKYKKALISVDFWEVVDAENKLVGWWDVECGSGKLSLTETTPCVASEMYNTMLFADGNKVRQWNYNSSKKEDEINNAKELLIVGGEESTVIITSLLLSADHKKTYVAFYDPEKSGLNGSVWVIDTDKGDVLEQYNNVCYQPVKVIYKKK